MRWNPFGRTWSKKRRMNSSEGHGFLPIVIAIILPAETHLRIFHVEEAIVGEGHSVRIEARVVEYLLGAGRERLGVDHPFCLPNRSQVPEEGFGVLECLERRE